MYRTARVPPPLSDRAIAGLLAFASSLLAGCFSVPASPKLLAPELAPRTVERTAWLDEIEFNDEYAWRGAAFADAFRINLRDYAKDGGYFREVKLVPGKVAPDDYVLRLTLDQFHQKRGYHPAYFPAAILTLTFYIWFGGPIVVDEVNFDGTLAVARGDGTPVTKVHSSFHDKGNKSLYSEGYVTADIIQERTAFIRSLLDKAVQDINGGGR